MNQPMVYAKINLLFMESGLGDVIRKKYYLVVWIFSVTGAD